MTDFPPDREGVVAIASRQAGDDRRSFDFDGEPPDDAGELPDLSDFVHENDLVDAMKERGYRLTMVGGGAGSDELRRFYFRKRGADRG
jgi:hypothetical protein